MANREVITDKVGINSCIELSGLEYTNGGIIPRRVITSTDVLNGKYEYRQQPVEAVSPSKDDLLKDGLYLADFFTDHGLVVRQPVHIINRNKSGTTDFIGAGIQIIEDEIHGLSEPQRGLTYIAQPAFRSQYITKVINGFSPSFVNLATIGMGVNIDQHVKMVLTWEELLVGLGLKKEKIDYQENWVNKKWGDVSMVGHEIYYCYQGFPLGDASFNTVISSNNEGFQFSDIGFGLERIRWLLRGGKYTDTFSITDNDCGLEYHNTCLLSSMALLAGSGIRPHYKEHGYQLRKMSKKLIENGMGVIEANDNPSIVYDFYNRWYKWTKLESSSDETVKRIKDENESNLRK